MSKRLYFLNSLLRCLPPTRLYKLKAAACRKAGINCASTARLVSSVQIWGVQNLTIGEHSFIGHEVLIIGGRDVPIHIGSNVDIAPRVSLLSGTHELAPNSYRAAGEGKCLPIKIEDGVWIGGNTTILGGVTIGAMAVIGAGSTVVSNIPPHVIAVGTPCKPIKQWDVERKQWVDFHT